MKTIAKKNTFGFTILVSIAAMLVLAASGAFDLTKLMPYSEPEAPAMSNEDLMKSTANLSFRKELSNAAFDTMMSKESHEGSREGAKVDFEAFKKEHILPWAAFSGVTSNWLYMDQGAADLATPEGRKKRYDRWTGYAAAIEKNAPEGVHVTAHPCRADRCDILVEWPEPNMAE